MGFFRNFNRDQAEGTRQQAPDKAAANTLLLLQQRASVELQRMLVKTGRGDTAELAQAERRLKELEEVASAECRVPVLADTSDRSARTDIFSGRTEKVLDSARTDNAGGTEIVQANADSGKLPEGEMLLRRELMNEIDSLMRQRADASNAMHSIPYDQPCPELMAKALSLHEQVEAAWTKYRYLERNGKLPEIETPQARQHSLELLQKMDERKRMAEKRSKLKKKLEDPTNTRHKKRDEWKEELDYLLLELKHLDDEIYLLKNR